MGKVTSLANKVFSYVDAKKQIGDAIVAVLLALIPILQHYKGLVDCASTTVLVLLVPYLLLRLVPTLRSFRFSNLHFAVILIAYFIYKLFDHGTYFAEIAQVGLMTFYLVCLCQNCINTGMLKKAAIYIASLAGLCLLAQYFFYYILGFHLQMVPTSALLAESEPWVLGAQTGVVSITGKVSKLYRPSAFFLEPSHLFMYSFPALFITLFASEKSKDNKIAALLISLGIVLSTSGMGIAVVIGAWGLFVALGNPEDGSFRLHNIIRKRNLIMIGSLMGIVVLAIAFVPFVRNSIVRIFNGSGGSSAIDGRTEVALIVLKKMSFGQWMIGVADTLAGIKANMPGFMATVYKYGIVGVLLSYEIYVKGLFKLNMSYFWFTVILLLVSFFSAHTHGTFFMLYYVMLLKEGHDVSDEAWFLEIKEPVASLYAKVKPRVISLLSGKPKQ